MDRNVAALQAAQKILEDHDAAMRELNEELRAKKKERVAHQKRVQDCIDVLCGRASPDLFTGVEEPPPEPAAGPIVCAPVGSGLIADIDGITNEDVICFRSLGVLTLSDLERKCGGYMEDVPVYLDLHKGVFLPSDIDRISKAIERHLKPGTVPADETGVRYPKSDDWWNQGLALLHLDPRVVKACLKQEVKTVGELHDWIDDESREQGGFFAGKVLATWLKKIARLTDATAKANAETLYQFFADHAFVGVPDKEVTS